MHTLRTELEALYAEDDRLRREFEAHQAKRQQEVYTRGEQPELIRRDDNFQMRHGRPVQQQQPKQQSAAPTMSESDSILWNAWLQRAIDRNSDGLIDAIVEFVCTRENKLREEIIKFVGHERGKLRDEVIELREQLASLRGDVELGVRAANGGIAGVIHRQQVIDLPGPFLRGEVRARKERDAA